MKKNGKSGKSEKQIERDREKLQSMLVAYAFIFIILIIAILMVIGSSSPTGLTGFMNEIKQMALDTLKQWRFKLDIYFRFVKSIFN